MHSLVNAKEEDWQYASGFYGSIVGSGPRGPKGIAKEPVSGMIEVTKTKMALLKGSFQQSKRALLGLYESMIRVLLGVSVYGLIKGLMRI